MNEQCIEGEREGLMALTHTRKHHMCTGSQCSGLCYQISKLKIRNSCWFLRLKRAKVWRNNEKPSWDFRHLQSFKFCFIFYSVCICVGVYVCVQSSFVVCNILLSVFSNKNSQNFREIYFEEKSKIINLLQLLNTVCSYLHWIFVCFVMWGENIFFSLCWY